MNPKYSVFERPANGWLQLYKEVGGHLTYNKVFVKNNKVVGWRYKYLSAYKKYFTSKQKLI